MSGIGLVLSGCIAGCYPAPAPVAVYQPAPVTYVKVYDPQSGYHLQPVVGPVVGYASPPASYYPAYPSYPMSPAINGTFIFNGNYHNGRRW